MSQVESLATMLLRFWAAITLISVLVFSFPLIVNILIEAFSPHP